MDDWRGILKGFLLAMALVFAVVLGAAAWAWLPWLGVGVAGFFGWRWVRSRQAQRLPDREKRDALEAEVQRRLSERGRTK